MSSSKKNATPNGDVLPPDARAAQETGAKKAVTSFIGMYMLVATLVASSWILGFFQFSFLWVFLTIGSLFIVWKSKISKIIMEHLCHEEAVLYRKRAFRQDESAEWFNFLLNRWWVFSSSNIEELVKKRLDERLWDIRPSFVDSLELSTFNVGEQTPNVKNVRMFECSEGTPGRLQPISWFNVHKPPVGLDTLSSYQVVVEADLSMMSEDFKMIFRGRLGSARVSVGFDLVVEDLNLNGTIQAIISLSMDIPFPHVSKATICFIEKPDVTFNIRMLRALSLMEIPLLKSWIHNNVMEGLTKAMVDPASVDMVFKGVGPTLMGQSRKKKEKAQGILTVHIKGSPPKEAAAEDIRYTVLSIGSRKRQTHEVPATHEWEDVCSFFIYSLALEKIRVKSKCMRLITSTTLEQNEVNLSSFPFQVNPVCETTVTNKDESKLELTMEYTPLPAIDLTDIENHKAPKTTGVAGVLYVCIHGASNVLAADKTGASDPYCVLFCDRKRIMTTPFIPRTRNPHWESWVEFFVADYTRSSLSFFVYDWDGTNAIHDDFLGSVHVNMSESQPEIVKSTMTLGYNRPEEGFTVDKACGQITVSVVFQPVPSVARSEKFRDVMKGFKSHDYLYNEDLMSPSSVARVQDRRSPTAYAEGLLSNKVIVELTILQGKDMMAMDRNGYSDPYCVVSVKDKKVFTTTVKKKTLFPKWNETVTTELSPSDDPSLTIDVFDKDVISKDFMGKLILSLDQLKELSIKGTSDWYTLEKAKTGKLQLKCQVIARDMLAKDQQNSPENVFEYPTPDQSIVVSPDAEIVDSSVISSPETSLMRPGNTFPLHSSPRKNYRQLENGSNRAQPDELSNGAGYEKSDGRRSRETRREGEPQTPQLRKSLGGMRHSGSSNSVNVMQRSPDNTSMVSSTSNSDKMFSVAGKVLRARGNFPISATEIYCKVKLEIPGNRLSLFHSARIIGKSQAISVDDATPVLDVSFEVDRGAGVPMSATLTFDLKHSSKEHLVTKAFTLLSLLGDADSVCKWLPMGSGIELEVSLSQGQPVAQQHRRSGNLFKSFSFRKDK